MSDDNRYKNSKIYTIRYRNDSSLIFVGSTTQPLYKRWNDHKKSCLNENNKSYNYYVYKKIRESDDFDNWYIELYEECSCDNKEQLTKREGEIIRQIGTLNKQLPGRSIEECKNDRKEKSQKYYEANKEKILEVSKLYRNGNKEKINQYRIDSKEKISVSKKGWYEKNKEKVSEKQKESIDCVCGCSVTKIHLKRHQQTKKHLDLINLNSNENDGNL